ncbi:hypothetical protein [Brachyspira pilosicoli]|uniref:hypothetical protein n=1 Tax=Brachyspira pilosicoli TaxID=52584 RepID=UPI0012F4941F|nr:hypothetical protein [Brachyspira pilosicoli]
MSKRVLRLVSILFLSSILVLSCSNANKTGSGDNNSGNGGSGTGGDGGTTPTPEGIAKYSGTWTAKFNANSSYNVIIGTDGKVTIDDGSKNPKEATDIIENGNTYTMKVQHITGVDDTITITFNDGTSGTITDSSDFWGTGVIRKQNNGNKGLWYYAGTWTLTPDQQQGQANITMIIKDDGTIDLKIGNQAQPITDIVDKGKEKYEGKFTPEGEQDQQTLTLNFTGDDTGTFTLSIGDKESGSGNMTKQK